MPNTALRTLVVRTFRGLRTVWLVAGVCLLVLLVAEGSVRLYAGLRGGNGGAPPGDPRAKEPWWADYNKDFEATRDLRWKPYVYFRRFPSYAGRYVNVDSNGRRVTPQPAVPATPAARVFFFGGSTMWGTSLRDDHTIAADASVRLQALAGPGRRIEVTNFGENGYVFTQEIIELMLQLRQGNVPDVVVFVDGINDAGAMVQGGVPGNTQNESKRIADFALGRAIDRTGRSQGLRRDLRAMGLLALEGTRQLELLKELQSFMPKAPPRLVSADSGARGTARIVASNAEVVEALAQKYGFIPLYVWQPTLHGTRKRLTKFEQRLMYSIRNDPFNSRLRDVHLLVPSILDTSMARVAPGRFVDESALFAGDTMHIYVDRVGHNSEAAIPTIVDAFWPVLRAAVEQKLPNIAVAPVPGRRGMLRLAPL